MTTTLLATGAQAASGTGAAVDVSALTGALRVDVDPRGTDLGTSPELEVFFDTAPAATGPWTQIADIRMSSGHLQPDSAYYWPQTTRRVVLTTDNFCRVRWSAVARGPGKVSLTLGVSG